MPGIARVGDIWSGRCCCHDDPTCIRMSGPIVTSSSNVNANSRGIARLNDIVMGNCGHKGYIATCSPNINCNGIGVARCGDAVAGCSIGRIVKCSGDVNGN